MSIVCRAGSRLARGQSIERGGVADENLLGANSEQTLGLERLERAANGLCGQTEHATQLSQRTANVALDIMGNEGQLRVDTEDAPLAGRFEGTYRCTVVETIGGGASEIQKNIIARRKLGLPKNF